MGMRIMAAVLIGLTVGSAQACERQLPAHRIGYWHYRVIGGQHCWYGPGGHVSVTTRRPRVTTLLPMISRSRLANTPRVSEAYAGSPEAAPVWPTRMAPVPLVALGGAPKPVERPAQPAAQFRAIEQAAPPATRRIELAPLPAPLLAKPLKDQRSGWPWPIILLAAAVLAWPISVLLRPRRYRPVVLCSRCGGDGRVNHRCGWVCVDDECPECGGRGR